MFKTIIFSLCLFSTITSNSKILTDTKEVHQSQQCSSKLIQSYLPDLEIEHRETSFIPSELLESSCTNFKDSCCLDEEFEALTNIARKNLEHLFNGVKEARIAFNLLNQLNSKKIQELIQLLSEDDLNNLNLTAEEIEEDLTFLKKEWKEISSDLSQSYKMVEKFGGGFNCTICEATNHSNFTNMNNINEMKIKFDYNYCYQLFNSPVVIATLEFVKSLKQLTTLSQVLSVKYGVKVPDHFRESHEKANQVDQLRISCLASTDDFSDDEQCAEMCLEIGKPNQYFFKETIHPLTTFIVMVTDYFGNQELLNSYNKKNDQSEIQSETSITSPSDVIMAFNDQWNIDYIIPPKDDYSPLNLNRMKVELSYDNGSVSYTHLTLPTKA